MSVTQVVFATASVGDAGSKPEPPVRSSTFLDYYTAGNLLRIEILDTSKRVPNLRNANLSVAV